MTIPATQQISTVTFPKEEWLVQRTKDGALVSIKPIPGTWTLLSPQDQWWYVQQGLDYKAAFSCPRCSQIGFISSKFDPPKEYGHTKVLPELHCRQCNFGCKVVFKNWDQRRLYCACFETLDSNQDVMPNKEYLHAEDHAEAHKYFWAQHGREVINLVGIAPVIGYFPVNPKSDKILVV